MNEIFPEKKLKIENMLSVKNSSMRKRIFAKML